MEHGDPPSYHSPYPEETLSQKKVHLNFSQSPSPCFPEGRKNHLPLTFLAAFWHAKAAFLISLFWTVTNSPFYGRQEEFSS